MLMVMRVKKELASQDFQSVMKKKPKQNLEIMFKIKLKQKLINYKW